MADDRVLREITPLMENDFMYVADRQKREFTYPIHSHDVYELNFVENAAGVNRIVGDHHETIGDLDLVLITSPDLEHVWMQGDCKSDDIREITIQFKSDYRDNALFTKNPMRSIARMFQRAQKGLAFPPKAIMQVYPSLNKLSTIKDGSSTMHKYPPTLHDPLPAAGDR